MGTTAYLNMVILLESKKPVSGKNRNPGIFICNLYPLLCSIFV